jgi:hypothetical protein
MRKRKSSELAININWSSSQDPTEDRPIYEAAKGLTAEILWSFVIMGILTCITLLVWLVS